MRIPLQVNSQGLSTTKDYSDMYHFLLRQIRGEDMIREKITSETESNYNVILHTVWMPLSYCRMQKDNVMQL